jgi:hypothetical protein
MTPLPSPVLCPRCHGRTLTCLHCEGDRFVWAREALTMRPATVQRRQRKGTRAQPKAPAEVVQLVQPGSLVAPTPPAPVYPRGATLWPPVKP